MNSSLYDEDLKIAQELDQEINGNGNYQNGNSNYQNGDEKTFDYSDDEEIKIPDKNPNANLNLNSDINYIDEKSEKIEHPKKFGIKLKIHQLANIYQMNSLEKTFKKVVKQNGNKYTVRTCSGVLGDQTGTGKTISLLGLIYYTRKQNIEDMTLFNNRSYISRSEYSSLEVESFNMKTKHPDTACTVIVVPNNLFTQWQNECEKTSLAYFVCDKFNTNKKNIKTVNASELFTDIEIKYLLKVDILKRILQDRGETTAGSKIALQKKILGQKYETTQYNTVTNKIELEEKLAQLSTDVEKKPFSLKKLKDYDCILVPASKYNEFARIHDKIIWKRVIFDEADSIKISNMNHITARFYWFVSATYLSLPNRKRIGMIKKMFAGMHSLQLSKSTLMCHPNFIKQSFDLPDKENIYYRCQQSQLLNMISGIVTPAIKNMINSGDIEGAIGAMGGTVDDDNNLADIVLKNLKSNLKDEKAKLLYEESKSDADTSEGKKRIKDCETKINSLRVRIKSLKEQLENIENGNEACPICMDESVKNPVITDCLHVFCADCLLQAIDVSNANSCPICRHQIDMKKLTLKSSKKKKDKKKESGKKKKDKKEKKVQGKVDTILGILNEYPEDTFLLFSMHNGTFTHIKNALKDANISYGILSGHESSILETIDKFKHKETRVLMLNSENNGAGLDLQVESHVILTHSMPPNLEEQSIGRAYRLGRTTPLKVFHLWYEGEDSKTVDFVNK
jgi:hypothetical protein